MRLHHTDDELRLPAFAALEKPQMKCTTDKAFALRRVSESADESSAFPNVAHA